MSSRYHPEDTEAVERLHARFMADNDLNDLLIEFQDKAYAMGRARGLQEALPAFDEAAERTAFESDMYFRGMDFTRAVQVQNYYASPYANGAWHGWMTCAKRKAGVE